MLPLRNGDDYRVATLCLRRLRDGCRRAAGGQHRDSHQVRKGDGDQFHDLRWRHRWRHVHLAEVNREQHDHAHEQRLEPGPANNRHGRKNRRFQRSRNGSRAVCRHGQWRWAVLVSQGRQREYREYRALEGSFLMPSSAAFGLPSVSGISYTSVSPVEGNQAFLVPIIYTTPIKRVEIQPTWGVFLRWLTTFKIDAATWTAATAPGSAVPKLRDTLLVDGLLWTVHRAVDSPDPLNGLWRLACTSLVIDPTLQDTINILLPVDSTDAAASPITTSQLEPSLTAL